MAVSPPPSRPNRARKAISSIAGRQETFPRKSEVTETVVFTAPRSHMNGTGGIEDFRAFIAQLGFEPPSRIEPGRFVRFSTNGERDDDAGYAKLFPDLEGGIVGDFRTGQSWPWQLKRSLPLSDTEKRARHERIKREQQEAEAQRQREENEAKAKACAVWGKGQPAPADHPYLVRKCVKTNGLR